MNIERFKKTVDYMLNNSILWDQGYWDNCFGYFTVIANCANADIPDEPIGHGGYWDLHSLGLPYTPAIPIDYTSNKAAVHTQHAASHLLECDSYIFNIADSDEFIETVATDFPEVAQDVYRLVEHPDYGYPGAHSQGADSDYTSRNYYPS